MEVLEKAYLEITRPSKLYVTQSDFLKDIETVSETVSLETFKTLCTQCVEDEWYESAFYCRNQAERLKSLFNLAYEFNSFFKSIEKNANVFDLQNVPKTYKELSSLVCLQSTRYTKLICR